MIRSLERIEELAARDDLTADPQDWTDEQYAESEERKAWRIGGKSEAAWAMEKLADYVRRQAENTEVAKARIDHIIAWHANENGKLQGSVDFFTEQLRVWHMSLITADPANDEEWEKEKNKTVSLPDGKLTVRKGSYSTEIVDEEAFFEWWDEQPLTVTSVVTEAKIVPKKGALGDYIAQTGESIPGVKYERSEPSYTVKPKVGE